MRVPILGIMRYILWFSCAEINTKYEPNGHPRHANDYHPNGDIHDGHDGLLHLFGISIGKGKTCSCYDSHHYSYCGEGSENIVHDHYGAFIEEVTLSFCARSISAKCSGGGGIVDIVKDLGRSRKDIAWIYLRICMA